MTLHRNFSPDTGGRLTPAFKNGRDTPPVVPKGIGLDPTFRKGLEHRTGIDGHTEPLNAGRGIRQPLWRSDDIDAETEDYGLSAIGSLLGLEQYSRELCAIGEHIIGPFERNPRAAVTGLPVRAIDSRAQAGLWQDTGECGVERDTGHKAEGRDLSVIGLGDDQKARGEIAMSAFPIAAATAPALTLGQGGIPEAPGITGKPGLHRFAIGRSDRIEPDDAIAGVTGTGTKRKRDHDAV
jgi:hypothetical protein